MAKKKGKNANYNFDKQKDPAIPMGDGEFANMPKEPKFLKFSNDYQYRDGIINSFTANIEEVSDIYENRRQE